MKRNIATPIDDIKAKDTRAQERLRLSTTETINSDVKKERLDDLQSQADTINRNLAKLRDQISVSDATDEEKSAKILEANIQADQLVSALFQKSIEVNAIMTSEERNDRLIELQKEDDAFDDNYGLKDMDDKDIEQRNVDAIRYADYIANEQYKVFRKAEYPSVGEQLDIIWKVIAQLPKLPQEAQDMVAAINAVKEKYPKAKNG